jgi:hypothetical protein
MSDQNDGALTPEDLDTVAGGLSNIRVGKAASTVTSTVDATTDPQDAGGTMAPDLSNIRVG